jgi:hypothetical protein
LFVLGFGLTFDLVFVSLPAQLGPFVWSLGEVWLCEKDENYRCLVSESPKIILVVCLDFLYWAIVISGMCAIPLDELDFIFKRGGRLGEPIKDRFFLARVFVVFSWGRLGWFSVVGLVSLLVLVLVLSLVLLLLSVVFLGIVVLFLEVLNFLVSLSLIVYSWS